jgi:trans-aconitate 2-methyltransferase
MAPAQDRDAWDPVRYAKFADERARPFDDLLGLVAPVPGGRVIDLGCGTGELTARLHAHTKAASTTGMDSSEAMLARARPLATDGLAFTRGDIGRYDAVAAHDVIAANAALQWLPDHPALLARLARGLRPGGQLAVQVPANFDHPSHALVAAVAAEEPFAAVLAAAGDADPVPGVLAPEEYAACLDDLGFADQHVRLQVYGVRLASTADVVEWTKGTTLTRVRGALPDATFERFVDRYRERLLAELGDRAPYFYAFKRILFWGRRP